MSDSAKGGLTPSMRRELERFLEDNPPEVYPNPMVSPWMRHPEIPRHSIGWRMGPAEQYKHDFAFWFRDLPVERQQEYRETNPEPEEWVGFYDLIIERLKNVDK